MRSTPASSSGERVQAFRRKLALVLLARSSAAVLSYWALGYGTVVLAARIGFGAPLRPLAWGLLSCLPVAAAAAVAARRRVPSSGSVRALLDREAGCGGLLMADAEVPLGAWRDRIAAAPPPRVVWRGGRASALAAGAALFVTASFVVPWHARALEGARPLEVHAAIERLEAQVEALVQEKLLAAPRAEALEERLKQAAAEADGRAPARTWETLDHLEQMVADAAREGAREALADTQQLRRAEELAHALATAGKEMGSEARAGALEELAARVQAPGIARRVPRSTLDPVQKRKPSTGELERLAAELHLSKTQLAEQLGRLERLRLIDAETAGACRAAGKCDGAGLAAFLKENSDSASVSELLQCWGRGGVNRGRGDAPLTFSDPTSERDARFKETALPPGALGPTDQSMLAGVSVAAPTPDRAAKREDGSGLAGTAAGGGSALTSTVLPRHRGSVKRFFERR